MKRLHGHGLQDSDHWAGSPHRPGISHVAVTTTLAAATGAIAALIVSWIHFGKPDLSMTLNGTLAGLVAITAGCNNVTPLSSIIIGLLAGILVVISVIFIERFLKIDDPVGAISVHGVCGAFGTLCVAIFNEAGFSLNLLYVQSLGVICAFIWSFVLCFVMFKIISSTIGLRVSKDEEIEGLDITEHGNIAYPDFVQAEK
ncbi:TPA: ammonium transporter [bacterium]|nr:ammonium transporter [bacterium]